MGILPSSLKLEKEIKRTMSVVNSLDSDIEEVRIRPNCFSQLAQGWKIPIRIYALSLRTAYHVRYAYAAD
jgi:hypothetical protein